MITYEAEANREHPEGCQCTQTDSGGDCEWCAIYYGRDMELIKTKLREGELIPMTREVTTIRNAVTFLEALGYKGGDIHDDLVAAADSFESLIADMERLLNTGPGMLTLEEYHDWVTLIAAKRLAALRIAQDESGKGRGATTGT